jgi:hypothetical protein
MAALIVALSRSGLEMVGFAGQMIPIGGGASSDSRSSIKS